MRHQADRHPYPSDSTRVACLAMGRLEGKAAIITGGEGSIGMATARAFIAEGARVLLAGVSEPGLTAGAAELGEQAAWKVTDVTDSAQVKAAVDGGRGAIRPAGRGRRQRGHRRGDRADRRLPGGRVRPDPRGARARRLPALQARGAAPDRRRLHHHHLERGRPHRRAAHRRLLDRQARAGRADADARGGAGAARHPGQHDPPGTGRQRVPAPGRGGRHRRGPRRRPHHLRRDDPAAAGTPPPTRSRAPWSSSPATTARS